MQGLSGQPSHYPGKDKAPPKQGGVFSMILTILRVTVVISVLGTLGVALYLYLNPSGYSTLMKQMPKAYADQMPETLEQFTTAEGMYKTRDAVSSMAADVVSAAREYAAMATASKQGSYPAATGESFVTGDNYTYIEPISEEKRAKLKKATLARDAYVTDVVYFDVARGDDIPMGRIIIGLFGDIAPKTVANFREIAKGTTHHGKTLHYAGSPFHRIIPNFMVQGGDMKHTNASGYSIYGRNFQDENFQLKHDKFCLSMANAGPNTNSSQFFITTVVTGWLDRKHVVFGKIIGSADVVTAVENLGSQSGTPKQYVYIKDSGVLESLSS